MPTLNMTFEATAGNVVRGRTFDAAVETRFLDWLWAAYPQIDDSDPENPVPLDRTPANEAAAYREFVDAFISSTWGNVKRWEQNEAKKAAEAGVPDIEDDVSP